MDCGCGAVWGCPVWGSDQIKQYDDNEICEYDGNDSDKIMNEERYKQSKTDTPWLVPRAPETSDRSRTWDTMSCILTIIPLSVVQLHYVLYGVHQYDEYGTRHVDPSSAPPFP